jgi:3',5'-cyclic-AMP phosphodiesterase
MTFAPFSLTAEHPPARHVLLHMSDAHLVAGVGYLYGAVDSEARLRQIFSELDASAARPDAIVFTGDLADKGEPGAYAKLRAIVEPAAAALGSRLIWVMGNHDNRPNLRRYLLDEEPDETPLDRTYDVHGLRVITLDSTVPGRHFGRIGAQQLEWLAGQLSTAAPEGTVLALHHPPIPCTQHPEVLTELRQQEELARVLEGTDVRVILAGHRHYTVAGTFAGIPVSVAAATSYTQDLNVPVGGSRGRDGAQSFNMLHVHSGTVLNSTVPIGTYSTVGEHISPEQTTRRLAAAGIRIQPPPGSGGAFPGRPGADRFAED